MLLLEELVEFGVVPDSTCVLDGLPQISVLIMDALLYTVLKERLLGVYALMDAILVCRPKSDPRFSPTHIKPVSHCSRMNDPKPPFIGPLQ
jgi:hypothetical protein